MFKGKLVCKRTTISNRNFTHSADTLSDEKKLSKNKNEKIKIKQKKDEKRV